MSSETQAPQSTSTESSLWQGSSSQWLNIGPFAVCALFSLAIVVTAIMTGLLPLLALLLVPLAYGTWRYLTVRCRKFTLSCERIKLTEGVINQKMDEVELYRVKDILMNRTWWMRLTGLSTLTLLTSERTLPELVIPAIPDGEELREKLRRQVEIRRDTKRVREMDFDSTLKTGDDKEDLPMDQP